MSKPSSRSSSSRPATAPSTARRFRLGVIAKRHMDAKTLYDVKQYSISNVLIPQVNSIQEPPPPLPSEEFKIAKLLYHTLHGPNSSWSTSSLAKDDILAAIFLSNQMQLLALDLFWYIYVELHAHCNEIQVMTEEDQVDVKKILQERLSLNFTKIVMYANDHMTLKKKDKLFLKFVPFLSDVMHETFKQVFVSSINVFTTSDILKVIKHTDSKTFEMILNSQDGKPKYKPMDSKTQVVLLNSKDSIINWKVHVDYMCRSLFYGRNYNKEQLLEEYPIPREIYTRIVTKKAKKSLLKELQAILAFSSGKLNQVEQVDEMIDRLNNDNSDSHYMDQFDHQLNMNSLPPISMTPSSPTKGMNNNNTSNISINISNSNSGHGHGHHHGHHGHHSHHQHHNNSHGHQHTNSEHNSNTNHSSNQHQHQHSNHNTNNDNHTNTHNHVHPIVPLQPIQTNFHNHSNSSHSMNTSPTAHSSSPPISTSPSIHMNKYQQQQQFDNGTVSMSQSPTSSTSNTSNKNKTGNTTTTTSTRYRNVFLEQSPSYMNIELVKEIEREEEEMMAKLKAKKEKERNPFKKKIPIIFPPGFQMPKSREKKWYEHGHYLSQVKPYVQKPEHIAKLSTSIVTHAFLANKKKLIE